jgi:hypothetical protein
VCVLSSGTINSKRALWALSSWPGKHSLSLYTRSQLPRPSTIGLKKPGEREGNGRGFGFLRHRFWLAAATRTYHTRHAPLLSEHCTAARPIKLGRREKTHERNSSSSLLPSDLLLFGLVCHTRERERSQPT